jgi:23S rRNA maturation-related 3'-5' exoribonuclease YhaM
MRFLKNYKELQRCSEYENVVFFGKILTITHQAQYTTVRFFDGENIEKLNVYQNDFEVETNKLYKFTGSACGYTRIWFKLYALEKITPNEEQNRIFFPEIYLKVTPELQYVYLNSFGLIENNNYKSVLKVCLGLGDSKATEIDYFKYPASLNHHDNYKGGLINHVASMLNIAIKIKMEYKSTRKLTKQIDWDLVLTLIYLHDVGKPLTYSVKPSGEFKWNDNIMLDHATLGVCYVYNKCMENGISVKHPDIQILLKGIQQHMTQEYYNLLPEVQFIKHIDSIDAILASTI